MAVVVLRFGGGCGDGDGGRRWFCNGSSSAVVWW